MTDDQSGRDDEPSGSGRPRPYVLVGLAVSFVVIFVFGLMPAILLTSGKETAGLAGCALVVLPVESPVNDARISRLVEGLAPLLVSELHKVSDLRARSGENTGSETASTPGEATECLLASEVARENGGLLVTSRVFRGSDDARLGAVEFRIPARELEGRQMPATQAEIAAIAAEKIAALFDGSSSDSQREPR